MAASLDEREAELRAKRICRFCLSQSTKELSSIYSKNVAHLQSNVPLPVQVMACVSIEVFSNDGMPLLICDVCRGLFDHAYRFKQMCKRAETLLRQFPLTGVWPEPLVKPVVPVQRLPKQMAAAKNVPVVSVQTMSQQTQTQPNSLSMVQTNATGGTAAVTPKKILNSNPVDSPEPPAPMRMQKTTDETAIFLSKFENDEELSIDDVQRLIAATEKEEEFITDKQEISPSPRKRPKVLNKSSIRILNKEAEVIMEPRLTKPQMKRDEEGNLAIVTEVIDPSQAYKMEPDPVKSAVPIETNVFPCPHCDRSFPLRQLREIHMTQHIRERSFQCGECDKSFFSKYDLQKHHLTHTGDRPFKCSICDKTFTRSTLLYRHEKTHIDIPKFICVYCEKPFISKEQMEKHTERHLKNRPWKCKICNKAFAFKQGLERHEVVHLIQQPYSCQYCEQSFSTPTKLARHLTAHAGHRPFPCKYCAKSYLLSHHLTRHMRSHKQVSSHFKCTECLKAYKTREELVYHSALHAKETLCCPLCKEMLKDVNMVKDHIKAHTEGDAYACEFCDLIFMTAERLQGHIALEHIEEMIPYNEDEKKQIDNALNANEQSNESAIDEFLWEELSGEAVQILDLEGIESADVTKNTQQNVVIKSKIIAIDSLVQNPETAAKTIIKVEENAYHKQPPIKVRKVYPNSTAALGQTAPRQVQVTKAAVSVEARHKTPVGRKTNQATATSTSKAPLPRTQPPSKDKLLIKENILMVPPPTTSNITINSMLKALPKSVSVRKSTATATAVAATDSPKPAKETSPVASTSKPKATNESKTAPLTDVQKRVLRGTSTRSNEAAAAGTKESSTSTVLLHNKQSVVKRTSPDNGNANTSTITKETQSGEKVVKMMFGDKKVKMHKITIPRAEADAMAKDGRIHIKDGNMILTQVQKKPSKPSK